MALLFCGSQNTMIASAILTFGYTVYTWIIGLFPAYTGLPTGITNALTWLGGTGAGLSCIVPVDTYRAQIVIIVYMAIILLGIRFFAWIFNREMKHPDGKSA